MLAKLNILEKKFRMLQGTKSPKQYDNLQSSSCKGASSSVSTPYTMIHILRSINYSKDDAHLMDHYCYLYRNFMLSPTQIL